MLLAVACGDDPEFRFGQNITGIEFELFDPTEGVHPSKVTLQNPRNPFRDIVISDAVKFDILANGGNAGAFYAWASLLATIPIGENQFGVATKLRDIYLANEVANPEDRETVRLMAIDAFQAILDCFPDQLLFDATGTFGLKLATLAFTNIIDLRGVPQGDWVLVTNSRGEPEAVRSTGFDSLAREVRCF
ncbi:MAG TPA: hypothetical protein VLS88_21020 [Polyangiales bacterium]|nr:hypothetical protein [Polyangiales bacterium]